jgi:hypothetical protein
VFKGKKEKILIGKYMFDRFFIQQDMIKDSFLFKRCLVHAVEKGSRNPRMVRNEWGK